MKTIHELLNEAEHAVEIGAIRTALKLIISALRRYLHEP